MKQLEQMNELLDAYGTLLTPRQREVMSCCFEEDFSFSEIAENFQISKAAVSDMIKRCEQILYHYEELLHLVEKSKQRMELYDKIKKDADAGLLSCIEQLEALERE